MQDRTNDRKRHAPLIAAVIAGFAAAVPAPAALAADEAPVKCYGINACGSHSKCAVSQADLDAVKSLVGAAAFAERFGKSEAHACGSHAKCGASSGILNWTETSAAECHEQGGIRIEKSAAGKPEASQA